MHMTCIGVDGELAVERVVPVTIGVATGMEFVSLNLLTMAWMYADKPKGHGCNCK